jgi:hypothetical protein
LIAILTVCDTVLMTYDYWHYELHANHAELIDNHENLFDLIIDCSEIKTAIAPRYCMRVERNIIYLHVDMIWRQ